MMAFVYYLPAPHTHVRLWGQGMGASVSRWSGLWPQVPAEWGQRPHLAGILAPCICFSSSPSPAFLFLLHVHCDSVLFSSLFFWFWSHRVTCMTSSGNEPRPLAMKAQSPNTDPPGNSSMLNIFFFSLQLLIFEMCSTHLTLWCQTAVTIVRFCYCMFPLMISGETVSIFSVSDRTRTMFVSAQNKVQRMWTLLKSRRPVWGSVAQCLSCVAWVVDFVFLECLLSFLELWPSSCLVGYHSRACLDNSNMQHFYVLNFGIGEYTWKAHYFTFQCVEKLRLLMSA